MSLITEFSKTGNFFFKYRSYLPLFLYVIAIFTIWFDKDEFFPYQEWWWGLSCFLITACGMLVRALTIAYTPRGTSGRNADKQVAEQLNTKGIYSIVRHPLYLGNFLMWLGLITYVGSVEFLIFGIFFFWLYYERIMFAEEEFIHDKFGEDFEKWAANTPPFFPKLKKTKKSGVSFSIKNVIKREYHGFFASIISFSIINFVKHLFYQNKLDLDIEWIIALGGGFIIYITVRIIVKTTRWFHISGR